MVIADDYGTLALAINVNNTRRYLLGHGSRVISASIIEYKIEERFGLAIVSADCTGSIGVWAVEDGRCLLFHGGEDGAHCPVDCIVVMGIVIVADQCGSVFFYDVNTLDLVYLTSTSDSIDVVSIHGYQTNGHSFVVCLLSDGRCRVLEIANNGSLAVVVEECPFMKTIGVIGIESSPDHRGLRVTYTDTVVVIGDFQAWQVGSFVDIQPTFECHCSSNDKTCFVIGGSNGEFIHGSLDSLFQPDHCISVNRTGLGSTITSVLYHAGRVWLGDADGAVITDNTKFVRIANQPVTKLMVACEHVLAVSADGTVAVFSYGNDSQLLYTCKFTSGIAFISIQQQHVLIQDTDKRQFKMDLTVGSIEPYNGATIDQIPVQTTDTPPDMSVMFTLGPHGLVKVLKGPSGFPGILLTVDVRAVLANMSGCSSFTDHLHSMIAERRFGLIGANGNISMLLLGDGDTKTDCPMVSPAESAVGLLAFLAMQPQQQTTVPKTLLAKPYPSLSITSKFWCDHVKALERSSRHLFCNVIKHSLDDSLIDAIVSHWQPHLLPNDPNVKPMNRAAVILGIIMLLSPNHRPPLSIQQSVAKSLLNQVNDCRKHLFRIAAVSLLGDLIAVVEPFVGVYEELVRPWMVEVGGCAVSTAADPWTAVLVHQMKTSIRCCIIHQPTLIDSIARDLQSFDSGTILTIFYNVVDQPQPVRLMGRESVMAETIVKLLDPANPKQRTRLLPTAAPLLHLLCSSLPTVSFHADRQLLAAVSPDSTVSVWDLSTGVRLFHHHRLTTAPLDAISISTDGDAVAVLSRVDGTVSWCRLSAPVSSVVAMVFGGAAAAADVKTVLIDTFGVDDLVDGGCRIESFDCRNLQCTISIGGERHQLKL